MQISVSISKVLPELPKINKATIKVVRTDFNQQGTISKATGRVWDELNSAVCTEAPGSFKG